MKLMVVAWWWIEGGLVVDGRWFSGGWRVVGGCDVVSGGCNVVSDGCDVVSGGCDVVGKKDLELVAPMGMM